MSGTSGWHLKNPQKLKSPSSPGDVILPALGKLHQPRHVCCPLHDPTAAGRLRHWPSCTAAGAQQTVCRVLRIRFVFRVLRRGSQRESWRNEGNRSCSCVRPSLSSCSVLSLKALPCSLSLPVVAFCLSFP